MGTSGVMAMASKKDKIGIQCLANSPKLCMQHSYSETYKTLLKEIKEDLNKGNDITCSWIRRWNIKRAIYYKLIYRFSSILFKIPADLFAE